MGKLILRHRVIPETQSQFPLERPRIVGVRKEKLRNYFERNEEMVHNCGGDFERFFSDVENLWREKQQKFPTFDGFVDHLLKADKDVADERQQAMILVAKARRSYKMTR